MLFIFPENFAFVALLFVHLFLIYYLFHIFMYIKAGPVCGLFCFEHCLANRLQAALLLYVSGQRENSICSTWKQGWYKWTEQKGEECSAFVYFVRCPCTLFWDFFPLITHIGSWVQSKGVVCYSWQHTLLWDISKRQPECWWCLYPYCWNCASS